jgi:cytoskeletal protein RodZ
MARAHRNRQRRARGEHGVTIVEYVLFFGCFVLVAVSAVGGLNSGARSYFQQSSSKIGQPVNRIQYDANGARQQQASTTSITAPPATTTTAAPTTAPTTTTTTTTTTIPPTTTTTTTTTTIPPTTTTTTTTVAQSLSSALSDRSTNATSNRWNAIVRVQLSATGGATTTGITITASFLEAGGSTTTRSCVTASNGRCDMSWNNRSDNRAWVQVAITGVSGGAPWTGSANYIQLNKV